MENKVLNVLFVNMGRTAFFIAKRLDVSVAKVMVALINLRSSRKVKALDPWSFNPQWMRTSEQEI